MVIGEDKSKVANIVKDNIQHFRILYSNILRDCPQVVYKPQQGKLEVTDDMYTNAQDTHLAQLYIVCCIDSNASVHLTLIIQRCYSSKILWTYTQDGYRNVAKHTWFAITAIKDIVSRLVYDTKTKLKRKQRFILNSTKCPHSLSSTFQTGCDWLGILPSYLLNTQY